ncbi:MAG: hypothetical protein LBQ22_13020 [Bacteroidales bacterium]|jgi:hypothetical protein|nr:hypothetical protein [Bacteroidales bacterium]
MKNFIVLLLLLFSINLFSQEDKILTNKQIKEDYGYFVNILKDVNPQLCIRKYIYNQDIINDIEKLAQNQIDTIESLDEFYFFLYKAINLCSDQHLRLTIPNETEIIEFDTSIQIADIKLNREIKKNALRKFNIGTAIPYLSYNNGNYYFLQEIKFYSKSRVENKKLIFDYTDTIFAGSKLTHINNIEIDEYIMKYSRFYDNSLRWDKNMNKFYSYYVFGDLNKKNDIYTIEYQNIPKEVKRQNIAIDGGGNTDKEEGNAFLLCKNILYIRIPEMNYQCLNSIQKDLKKIKKGKNLEAVIIDVRGNIGGSDLVWMELLSDIINEEIIEVNVKLASKKSKESKEYIKSIFSISNIEQFAEDNSIFICEDTMFNTIYGNNISIEPSEQTIKHSGKIFILKDFFSYSSALSLVSFTSNNNLKERFKVVGTYTELFGGRGFDPALFILPNSRIIFQIEPVIDVTNIKNMEDILQDIVDIEVNQNLEDWINEINYKGKRYGKKYLLNNDSYIREILNYLSKIDE